MAAPDPQPDRTADSARENPPPTPRVEEGASAVLRTAGPWHWRMLGLLKTMRPHQWVKNIFVLAPVAFAKEIFDPLLLYRAFSAFAIFCVLAGAVYTMNDLLDRESDRLHPVKRRRPIASGRVPLGLAKGFAVVMVIAALGGAAYGPLSFLAVAAAYFGLNLAYSFKLKNVAYLDVSIIAAGFVLRVLGGGFATHIHVSGYLLACTALLALFLGFGKRRQELATAKKAGKQRAALESYSQRGLDVALAATGTLTVVSYLAYTLDPHTRAFFQSDWLWPSAVLVGAAMVRFLHLVRSRPKAESPTQEMLTDGPFVGIVLVWGFLAVLIVYNLRPQ